MATYIIALSLALRTLSVLREGHFQEKRRHMCFEEEKADVTVGAADVLLLRSASL